MRHPPTPPRDKDALVREIDATIKVKDIKSLYRLRDAVEVKWWESGLILVLFVSALGFIASVVLSMSGAESPGTLWLQKTVLFWLIPLILSIVLTLEVLLSKINALRRLNELTVALLDSLRKEQEKIRPPEAAPGDLPRHEGERR